MYTLAYEIESKKYKNIKINAIKLIDELKILNKNILYQ